MNPLAQSCHNPDCTARGHIGPGNIRAHCRKDRRYRRTACRRTFAATADAPSYRLKVATDVVALALALVSHGRPLQAVVAAFGHDARTVAAWRDRAGRHAREPHRHHVLQGRVELGHVRADELIVRAVGRRLRMAPAMAVPSRPWLGGVASVRRDGRLITAVVPMVRQAAKACSSPACVDGLASYVTALDRAFRDPVRAGHRGRPRLVAVGGLLLGQPIERRSGRRLIGIARRAVRGTAEAITAAIVATGTGTGINTAYVELLNATSRARLCPLGRRGRATVRGEGVMTRWMDPMGCWYHSCCEHGRPRVEAAVEPGRERRERPPAMAAGRTDHGWSMEEVLSYAIASPARVALKRCGRPPKRPEAAP